MDQKELREWEAKCTQEEPPACRAGCPLGVDARAFVLAMGRDNPRAAWAVLEKTMPLAGIYVLEFHQTQAVQLLL